MKYLTSEEFYLALQASDYGKQYLDLVDKVKLENRGLEREAGYEIHHIQPRKLGGTNSETVKVTYYEHCTLHYYLAKAIPCIETFYPINILSNMQLKKMSDIDRVNLEDILNWSRLREEVLQDVMYSEEAKERFRGESNKRWSLEDYRVKQSNAHKGKTSHLGIPVSLETRQKISQTLKSKNCKPPGISGRIKVTGVDGTVKFIFPDQLDYYKSCGWKRCIKKYIKKGTNSAVGKVWVHKGSVDRRVPKSDIQVFLSQGYVSGYSKEHRRKLSEAHKNRTLLSTVER